jgi:dTDP-4-amino-4,6-dideoxygalactose transaminase
MTLMPRRLPRGQIYYDTAAVVQRMANRVVASRAEGTDVRRFEAAFAAELGAQSAIAFPHARVALLHLLRVLALPAGSEVLMTPVTIPEIVSVIILSGLRPVFVDLGTRTCNIDCDDLERKITERSRMILLTHLCGIPSDVERVRECASRHGLEVLEDCSQAPGAHVGGRVLGSWGRAGFFSLTPLKPVSTFHGGMVITDDLKLAADLRRSVEESPPPLSPSRLARFFARDTLLHLVTEPRLFSTLTWHLVRAMEGVNPERVREFQRGNFLNKPEKRRTVVRLSPPPPWMFSRYSDLQAVTGFEGLKQLAEGNRRRRELSLLLHDLLTRRGVPGLVRFEVSAEGATFWRFPLWTPADRIRSLRQRLLRAGVDSSPTNLECCSRVPAFQEFAMDTPEARRFVDDMIFLPMHSNLREADMHRVSEVVAASMDDGPRPLVD